MAIAEAYRRQVSLLLRILPFVAEERCFALKGGTAINLFFRDMPRLSVDIDLTYVPIAERSRSLNAIDAAMKQIAGRIASQIARATIQPTLTEGVVTKLNVRVGRVQTLIEVTPVLRGCVY